jgi:membrane-bound lytic murein transglycosylase D
MKKNKQIKDALFSLAFFLTFSLLYLNAKILFASSESPADYNGPSESLFNLHIPKDLQFAGEPIPQNDYSIKENIEKVFNGGNFEKSTAFILFNRAAAWFPLIEKTLKRNTIPEDFKYIALAESRLTNSTSPQGAVGFWQFIRSTGSNYGLEITNEVDERYSVEKSTEAACRFFKDAYKRLGNWTLVAAAYNLGMGGIEYHMKKQPSKNYYDLMMNKETSFYIYRILALKTVFTNSRKKFYGGRNIYNIPTTTFKTDTTISDLSEFAISKGCTYEILKTFNPWIIANSLTNPGRKIYLIKIPKKEYVKKLLLTTPEDTVIKNRDTLKVKNILPDTLIAKPDTAKEIKNE